MKLKTTGGALTLALALSLGAGHAPAAAETPAAETQASSPHALSSPTLSSTLSSTKDDSIAAQVTNALALAIAVVGLTAALAGLAKG